MEWSTGTRRLKRYETKEESYQDCERIWRDGYGGRIPTLKDAEIYTGGDSPERWHKLVMDNLNLL